MLVCNDITGNEIECHTTIEGDLTTCVQSTEAVGSDGSFVVATLQKDGCWIAHYIHYDPFPSEGFHVVGGRSSTMIRSLRALAFSLKNDIHPIVVNYESPKKLLVTKAA